MASLYPNPLSTRFLDGVVMERPEKNALRKNYIGLNFMPYVPVDEYELTWDVIRAANRVAGIYAMDGTPIPGDDPGFYQKMANVINIMAARKLEEADVMTLREPGELALKSKALGAKRAKAMRRLRTKIANADDEVDSTVEYMIMQTLQGSVTWPPKDADGNTISNPPAYWGNAGFTLDLGFRAAFVQSVATLSGFNSRAGGGYNWKNASADPFLDLEVIREHITETAHINAYGSTIIMSSSALSWMATRPNVINWFKGDHAPVESSKKFIDYMQLQNYVKTALGFNILLYDSVWTYETAVDSESGVTENLVRFLPINKAIIVPPGLLTRDTAYFATAPISGPNDAYKTGKQTWSDKLGKPPWTWEIGVQLKGFPILKHTQEIFVLTLW